MWVNQSVTYVSELYPTLPLCPRCLCGHLNNELLCVFALYWQLDLSHSPFAHF